MLKYTLSLKHTVLSSSILFISYEKNFLTIQLKKVSTNSSKFLSSQLKINIVSFYTSLKNMKFKHLFKYAYSEICLLVLDCSALYDCAIQNTSPRAGMAVSRYSWDDWVKNA